MGMDNIEEIKAKRKPVNLTVREDILADAKSLGLNTSKAAEAGIQFAVKKAKEERWLKENKKSLDAYNKRIEEKGLLLTPDWAQE